MRTSKYRLLSNLNRIYLFGDSMKLSDYDKIILSVSGGKDSQAMVEIVASETGVSDKLVLVYADTGAEWKESVVQCELISKKHNIPLVVSKAFRPLPEEILRRKMWPSASCRKCTSNCKRSNIEGCKKI